MFFKKKYKETLELANLIYKLIINQSRVKEFYSHLKVPDTIDGRFELIILHFFFVDNSLDKENFLHKETHKEILNIMYKDFDMNLREIGVGDLSVGKKIYQMIEALSGRIFAYRNVMTSNKKEIKFSVKKNIYGTVEGINDKYVDIMASYFEDSIKYVKKNLNENITENSSVFLSLNRYIK